MRLVDQVAAASSARIIDGVWKRTLPWNGWQRFPLREVPDRPRLRFSIGLASLPQGGRIRFDVRLRRPTGLPIALYSHELNAPGWVDEEIDLSSYDLKGADLVFGKTVLEGTRERLVAADWGEPTLVSGAAPKAPSVILISLDTLRADRVGVYGRKTARTPAIDALAARSVWYTNAYSASSWTFPSHASMLRSIYPVSLPDMGRPEGVPIAPASNTTLADRFRAGGYLTAGFTGGGFMSDAFGFTAGFDTYFMYQQPPAAAAGCAPGRFDGAQVFERATRWLRASARHPFFLFVHTYDAHDRCPVQPPGLTPYQLWPDPGPDGRQRVADYYDELVAKVDVLVARLLGEIDALGLGDQVVVALTSDHGDELWEHGTFGHSCAFTLYDPLIKVPLIIRTAGRAAKRGRIEQPVAGVDIAPTLLALAGLTPPAEMRGSLLPGLGLPPRPESAPIYIHCGDQLAVRVGPHKLITSSKPGTVDALFDLARDPDEKDNAIGKSKAVTELLQRHARQYWELGSATPGPGKQRLEQLDETTRERLRALGYAE